MADSSEVLRFMEVGSCLEVIILGYNKILGLNKYKCALLGTRQVLIFCELSDVTRQAINFKIRHKLTQIVL